MLSKRDREVLDFEQGWFQLPGPKDRAIREYLGISANRYYQVLMRLVEDPDALEYDQLTVRRLRKVRRDALERRIARLKESERPTEA